MTFALECQPHEAAAEALLSISASAASGRDMMVDFRDTVDAGLAHYGYDAASGPRLRAIFDEAYPALRKRYGDWHGFDAMFVPHFGGQAAGTYLGY